MLMPLPESAKSEFPSQRILLADWEGELGHAGVMGKDWSSGTHQRDFQTPRTTEVCQREESKAWHKASGITAWSAWTRALETITLATVVLGKKMDPWSSTGQRHFIQANNSARGYNFVLSRIQLDLEINIIILFSRSHCILCSLKYILLCKQIWPWSLRTPKSALIPHPQTHRCARKPGLLGGLWMS